MSHETPGGGSERIICSVDRAMLCERRTIKTRRSGGFRMPGAGASVRTSHVWVPSWVQVVVTRRRVAFLRGGRIEQQLCVDADLATQLVLAGREAAEHAADAWEHEGYVGYLQQTVADQRRQDREFDGPDDIMFLTSVHPRLRRWRPVTTPAGWVFKVRRRLRRHSGMAGSLVGAPLGCALTLALYFAMLAVLVALTFTLHAIGFVIWLLAVVVFAILHRYGLPLPTEGIDLRVARGAAIRRAGQAEATRKEGSEAGGVLASGSQARDAVFRALGQAASAMHLLTSPFFLWVPDPEQRTKLQAALSDATAGLHKHDPPDEDGWSEEP
jgi:type IV secretory pathway TrbD component